MLHALFNTATAQFLLGAASGLGTALAARRYLGRLARLPQFLLGGAIFVVVLVDGLLGFIRWMPSLLAFLSEQDAIAQGGVAGTLASMVLLRNRRAGSSDPANAPRGTIVKRLFVWSASRLLQIVILPAALHGTAMSVLPPLLGLPNSEQLRTILSHPSVVVTRSAEGETHAFCTCELPIRREELPKALVAAVVTVEDRRFTIHSGFDWYGVARALARSGANWIAGKRQEGGSTITQQLAKTVVGHERTLSRKIAEFVVAKEIEAEFAKDDIITLYLNRVYFGRNLYGIEAAARAYYGRKTEKLTLWQSAELAGMLKAPATYDPLRRNAMLNERTKLVLTLMKRSGRLTSKAFQRAIPGPQARGEDELPPLDSGYFTNWVVRDLSDTLELSLNASGQWRVSVSLDTWKQVIAVREVRRGLRRDAALKVGQAALVAMDTNGRVLAHVGGRDFRLSQFDRATQAVRQIGSLAKVFVFAAAFEAGHKPMDTVLDAPIAVGTWTPQNYDMRFLGKITFRDALAGSRNVATVRIAQAIGTARVAAYAEQFNIKFDDNPAASLGTSENRLMDMTSAYATFAALGREVRAHAALLITNMNGRVIEPGGPGETTQLIDRGVAERMIDVLSTAVSRGTGKSANYAEHVFGKTGTTQQSRDAWFVGGRGNIITGVWYGNDDHTPMIGVTGATLPAETFKYFMQKSRS